MKKEGFFIVFLLLYTLFVHSQSTEIIPKPFQITQSDGQFRLTSSTTLIVQNPEDSLAARYLNDYLFKYFGLKLKYASGISRADIPSIVFGGPKRTNLSGIEAYELDIRQGIVYISGSKTGVFYGVQSLIQLLHLNDKKELVANCYFIADAPRFAWRGMHLDVSRHFFSKDDVKKYIDYLAYYKFNRFHWHLTDDQGWRIEIKKYPKLTGIGSKRKETIIAKNFNPYKGDASPYGGFYTQEEVKEIVKYASDRAITVVPEIEMPGHALAALAAYPEYSCAGGPFETGTKWGVFDDVFCAKDETFPFLEDILTEILALFPSEYIHVGGDECPKTRWKTCPKCQVVIKREHLKDEHELQSYFIQKIEKFLNSKNRKLIGWDEILEGGLAPNAAVMSWRGEAGGTEAAQQKHEAVMCPGTHCYFDHYQSKSPSEPLAIGGFTPLEKVYDYEPIPKALSNDEAKYILGAQANVWTEYIPDFKQVEYMIFPRICALSEVLWTQSELKNKEDFMRRVELQFPVFELWKANYSGAYFEISAKQESYFFKEGVSVTLSSRKPSATMFYTLDGSEPNAQSQRYENPILMNKSAVLKAALFVNEKQVGKTFYQNYLVSKATGKDIKLSTEPDKRYSEGGAFALVNGLRAGDNLGGGYWLGWQGPDLEAVIDLNGELTISRLGIGVHKMENSWIYLPQFIEVFISSDGKTFQSVAKKSANEYADGGFVTLKFNATKAKFIKVLAKNYGLIPDGKDGAGNAAWLFVDEIVIE